MNEDMKKRFVCRRMLKTGLCCIALDVIGNTLLAVFLILLAKNIDKVISILIPTAMALVLLVTIFALMLPYFGTLSCDGNNIVLSKFNKKYTIKVGQKVVFIFRNPWRPRFTDRSIYPMKIRVKGEKEIIPIQIVDKEVIEFLRLKLNYVVDPQDFDFNRI